MLGRLSQTVCPGKPTNPEQPPKRWRDKRNDLKVCKCVAVAVVGAAGGSTDGPGCKHVLGCSVDRFDYISEGGKDWSYKKRRFKMLALSGLEFDD